MIDDAFMMTSAAAAIETTALWLQQQPGTPQPPGNPDPEPVPSDPEVPVPAEEPPKPIPEPPIDVPVPPVHGSAEIDGVALQLR